MTQVKVTVNGTIVRVAAQASVAAAVAMAGESAFRTSVSGQPRGPLCGMGICFECRVTIDGAPHQRACMIECQEGMDVRTGS